MERSGAPYIALENNGSRVTHASDPILIFLDQYKVLQKRSVSHNPPHHNTKRLFTQLKKSHKIHDFMHHHHNAPLALY